MRLPPAPRPWALALCAASGFVPLAPLRAQEPSAFLVPTASESAARLGPVPGTVEIGVSAGLAHTGRWYETATALAGTVNSGTTFSAEVRYWPVPWAGIRLQAGRFDGKIRTTLLPYDAEGFPSPQPLDATVYDASLVVRPLASTGVPSALSTLYAFAGGGGVDLELARGEIIICDEEPENLEDDCGRFFPEKGTVRQFTAGAGADLVRVRGFTLFAEASLHRYRTPFSSQPALLESRGARDVGVAAAPSVAFSERVVTSRFSAGARRAFGARPRVPTPPPAPPSPTTGGIVTVRTVQPGAEVYLVPRSALEDDPGLRCRLRPVLAPGSYFAGRTTGAQPLRVPAGPRAWVLVVRQQVESGGRRVWHVHEQRVQLAGGSTLPVQLDMRRDGSPPPPCPR